MGSFSDMKYFRIQTSRVSIGKLISAFQLNIENDEYLVSPRPLPGITINFYFALACVKPEGININIVKKFKNCKEITIQDYENEKASIKHCWVAKPKTA